jgi:hypothetical protein
MLEGLRAVVLRGSVGGKPRGLVQHPLHRLAYRRLPGGSPLALVPFLALSCPFCQSALLVCVCVCARACPLSSCDPSLHNTQSRQLE